MTVASILVNKRSMAVILLSRELVGLGPLCAPKSLQLFRVDGVLRYFKRLQLTATVSTSNNTETSLQTTVQALLGFSLGASIE